MLCSPLLPHTRHTHTHLSLTSHLSRAQHQIYTAKGVPTLRIDPSSPAPASKRPVLAVAWSSSDKPLLAYVTSPFLHPIFVTFCQVHVQGQQGQGLAAQLRQLVTRAK